MTKETRFPHLTRPTSMDSERYLYGVVPVHGHDAWDLFSACAAGDLSRVRALLERDENLVNAQYWYQFPIHMAVREGHADVVQVLLEAGADPGQSRYNYSTWDKLLAIAQERGHHAVLELLQTALTERFGYDPAFEAVAQAIRERDASRVGALLEENSVLARASDARGNTGLHWAAITRNHGLIDRFLDGGVHVEARRGDGRTPVLTALDGDYWFRAGNLPDGLPSGWETAGYLLDRGASVDLSVACMQGDVDTVRRFLDDDPGAATGLLPDRTSPLYRAARNGRADIVQLLLERGANPSAPEDLAPHGRALHEAAGRNDLAIADMLLQAGADPNAESDSSGDCLFIAQHCLKDKAGPMLDLLRRHGAVDALPETDEGLIELLQRESELDEMVVSEVFHSADKALHDLFFERHADRVPTMVAGNIWGGELPSVELLARLLDHGLDPNRPNWIGRTFLHVAAGKGTVDIVAALLEAGADLEAIELEHGGTPLATAARVGRVDIVKFLLSRGADPDAPAQSPWATARTWAHRSEDDAMRQALSGDGA